MAGAMLLQDWICVNGSGLTTVVTQSSRDYADLETSKDVVLFVEMSDALNVELSAETSPTRDDNFFKSMGTVVVATSGAGVFTVALRYATGAPPLARFLRWRLTGHAAGAWSMTFRIWLSPNESGQVRRMQRAKKALAADLANNDRRKNPPGPIPGSG